MEDDFEKDDFVTLGLLLFGFIGIVCLGQAYFAAFDWMFGL